MAELVSMNAWLKELFPLPGQRIKQWVVDRRRERNWEAKTCPFVQTMVHDDNTGIECRNAGGCQYCDLEHDCCYECNDLHEMLAKTDPKVRAWLAEKAARPPIESDRSKWSDQIEPERIG